MTLPLPSLSPLPQFSFSPRGYIFSALTALQRPDAGRGAASEPHPITQIRPRAVSPQNNCGWCDIEMQDPHTRHATLSGRVAVTTSELRYPVLFSYFSHMLLSSFLPLSPTSPNSISQQSRYARRKPEHGRVVYTSWSISLPSFVNCPSSPESVVASGVRNLLFAL